MNELTTYSWTFDEDVYRYKEAGYGAIGIWRHKLNDFGDERGIDLLAENGLTASNVLWAGGFTGSDGRRYEDSVRDAIDAIHLTAALGGHCLVVYSGSRAGHTYNHARRITRNALKRILPVAEECQVYLALEPVHPLCGGEWSFFHSLDETLRFIHKLSSPYVKLAFDTYHLGQDDLDLELLRHIAPRIGIVHLADARSTPCGEQNRCLLGEGSIPIREIVSALAEGGYDGYYDIELRGEDVESWDYEYILKHSRQAIAALTSPV